MLGRRYLPLLVGLALVQGLVVVIYSSRDVWMSWLQPKAPDIAAGEAGHVNAREPKTLKLNRQARDNLQLVARPATFEPYWRTIQVPGVVVDRPGQSDRGITAPAVGVVTRVHAHPGDTVKVGDRLFTLRLVSEYLQHSQSELFRTTREMQLVQQQRNRFAALVKAGTESEIKVTELDNQLQRLKAAQLAYRQDLLTRGLTPEQMMRVEEGQFVAEIEIVAPPPHAKDERLVNHDDPGPMRDKTATLVYEVQELQVNLGQQVQAGKTLCLLANHHSLYIEGRGFKREAPFLEQAAQNGWPVRVEFAEDDGKYWPPLKQTFHIRHLANTLDAESRTFAFYLPLSNQSRSYEKDGQTFLVWRFRPGQRVRLHVPVEEFGKKEGKPEEKVFVLPAAAVVREGPEAYVFQQNGDLFDRIPVHVLYEDRLNIVLANDGGMTAGLYYAQNAASSLNRILKAQNTGSGLPPGAHFHADGSLHIPGQ